MSETRPAEARSPDPVPDPGPDPGPDPALGVVIVTFNSTDVILDCLESLFAATGTRLAIAVVDNASTDGTAALLRDWAAGRRPYVPPADLPFALHPCPKPLAPARRRRRAARRGGPCGDPDRERGERRLCRRGQPRASPIWPAAPRSRGSGSSIPTGSPEPRRRAASPPRRRGSR